MEQIHGKPGRTNKYIIRDDAEWAGHGLGVAFRISCKETSADRIEQQSVTPKWVMEAGARGGFYRNGRATYIGYHGDARDWYTENPEWTVEFLECAGWIATGSALAGLDAPCAGAAEGSPPDSAAMFGVRETERYVPGYVGRI